MDGGMLGEKKWIEYGPTWIYYLDTEMNWYRRSCKLFMVTQNALKFKTIIYAFQIDVRLIKFQTELITILSIWPTRIYRIHALYM